jgi:hypothetical protein
MVTDYVRCGTYKAFIQFALLTTLYESEKAERLQTDRASHGDGGT